MVMLDCFGQRLKLARLAKGFTQPDVAKILGLTLRAYQRYEANEREPSLENLAKLSKHFGVSSDYLLGISDEAPFDER